MSRIGIALTCRRECHRAQSLAGIRHQHARADARTGLRPRRRRWGGLLPCARRTAMCAALRTRRSV